MNALNRFGPGHNSFTVAEDGTTDVMIYHARDYKEINGEPLYDPNRHTRARVLKWTDDGMPYLWSGSWTTTKFTNCIPRLSGQNE
jgi:GH43 family beta-xylosidase